VIGGDDWMNGSSHINFLHRSWSLTAIRNKGLLRQLLRGIFCKGGCVYSWICWSDCYLLRETEGKETGTGTGIIRTKSKESWPILDKPANEYPSLPLPQSSNCIMNSVDSSARVFQSRQKKQDRSRRKYQCSAAKSSQRIGIKSRLSTKSIHSL
jgi:hypothetical protein